MDIKKAHGKKNFTANEDMDLRILDEAFDRGDLSDYMEHY